MTATRLMIDATGAARRLQALACAGYGTGHLANLMAAQRLYVRAWQQHHRVKILWTTHQRIDYTYLKLWDTDGPSTLARQHARRRGWLPFEAWTDRTIDDPGAAPYCDPEAVGYIDRVKLAKVVAHQVRYIELTGAEKMELLANYLQNAVARTIGERASLRSFINRFRPVPRRELRYLVMGRPEIWPLFQPDDLAGLLDKEVRVEDLWLVG